MELKINVDELPLEALILVTASKRHVSVTLSNETCLSVPNDVQFKSNISAMRYLANTDTKYKWMGSNALQRCEINHWITYSIGTLTFNDNFDDAINYLDKIIAPVTYLVGNRCSLADIVVWSKLFTSPKWIDLLQTKTTPVNITRWYSFIASLDYVKEAVTYVGNLTDNFPAKFVKKEEKSSAILETGRKEEGKFVDLPGAEMGKVIVRFPPEASGYLHIGHAKAALLNQYYKEAFNGKLIMRFDDTNPAKEKEDYERVILEDLKLLNIDYDMLTRTSNYFDVMLEMCEKLIKDGKAYVDDTDAEEMKKEREKKICSKNRDNSFKKNITMWNDMKKGSERGQKCCVRAKIDMQSLNGCLRDPTIYRCKTELHPQTGDKYKVYPTYDFACPIVDSLEGVTHCLRTMEYHDRDEQFYWFIDVLGLRKPYIWEYSRLNMTNTVLSKRKLTWFVENSYVNGWDDPRMPTVRGILRRGMTVEGLKQFIIAQGSSRSVVLMEWDKIWAINKKVIDPVAPRYTAVDIKKIQVQLLNVEQSSMKVAKHPKNNDIGEKTIWTSSTVFIDETDAIEFKENENVTFINWGNIMVKKISKNNNNQITEILATPNLIDKNYKKTLKITWLADVEEAPLIPVVCYYFDHIISKGILGKDEDFKQYIQHNSMFKQELLGEPELINVKKSEIIQLQRKGFFICEQPYQKSTNYSFKTNPLVLIYIPDGHSKSLPAGLIPVDTRLVTASCSSSSDLIKQYIEQEKIVQNLQKANKRSKQFDIELQKLISLKQNCEAMKQGWMITSAEVADNLQEKKDDTHRINNLLTEIFNLGEKIRKLKSEKADKKIIQECVKTLLELKAAYKEATGEDWKPGLVSSVANATTAESAIKTVKPDGKELLLKITEVGDKIRKLKADKADKASIDQEVKCLLQLKADYKALTGQDWKPELAASTATPSPVQTASGVNELLFKITEVGNKIRKLKADKADKASIDQEVKCLLQLKADYKALTGQDWKPELAASTAIPSPVQTASGVNELLFKITEVGNKIRTLKADKADKNLIDEEVKILLQLKNNYKNITGKNWTPGSVSDGGHQKVNLENASKNVDVIQLTNEIKDQGNTVQLLTADKLHQRLQELSIAGFNKEPMVLDIPCLTEGGGGGISQGSAKKLKNVGEEKLQMVKASKQECSKAENEKWHQRLQELSIAAFNKEPMVLHIPCLTEDGGGGGRSQGSAKKLKNVGEEKVQKVKASKQECSKAENENSTLKKVTRLGLEAKKEDNLPDWYSQIIVKSELIEYYDISGCYILRPWSYAIWESIKDFLDSKIKELGVKNCYFPIFVSKAVLEKEKTHIADFAPEVAWVTKSGDSDLAEPIAVRPTSETVMYPAYAKWIQSYRDLPMKLNQWNNVVRWEFKHPQPFLRTREFLWQEGHTAFATYAEAETEVYTILEFYAAVYTDLLAIPVVRGKKTEKEKFAGGDYTLTVEAYIAASGRAIQGGTSHHLGQNFSKMFEIIYEDPVTQEKKFVYQNSWGITTRTIGVLIMVHADNQGLVLPPRVASVQCVIIPCGLAVTLKQNDKEQLLDMCNKTCKVLKDCNIRCELDDRDNYSAGWKFNHWELKGVPVRIEIGPKDLQQKQIVAVRRDSGQKSTILLNNITVEIPKLLDTIQSNLLSKATNELKQHMIVCKEWNTFCQELDKKNILLSPYCGRIECEDKIKEESARTDPKADSNAPSMGAKSLCIPFEQPAKLSQADHCIHPACSAKPQYYCLFGRSY